MGRPVRQHGAVHTPQTRQTRSVLRRGAATITAVVVLGATACTAPTDGASESATTGCAATIADASQARETAAQVRLLDRALTVCGSYDTFTAELGRYPSMIGYDPATYVAKRCTKVDDRQVRRSPTCRAVVAATTVPTTAPSDISFVGNTLDGRTVELRPSARVAFVGEYPAVIQQTVDIAAESGCDGVFEQRDLWASQVDDTPAGDEASVYAEHAQNVATFIGCDERPLGGG